MTQTDNAVTSLETRMAAALEHSYRYCFASEVKARDAGAELRLATSGGVAEFPYFFQGALKQPRMAAQLLRVLSKVVAARFHIPPAMLKRIVAQSDPVVTSGGGLLRFEGFSACCSAYARVDFAPEAYDGVVVNHGTTNVDFNAAMRAALAQIRDGERVSLAVGTDEVALLRGAGQIVERKVRLPVRWLRSFTEVQAFQSRLELRAELGRVETLRFLRSLPRSTMAKTVHWLLPAGRSLRLTQRPTPESVRLAGLERLRLLEELAPAADGLRLYVDPRASATEWQLRFGPLSFCLTLSAEVWRGFSGEGQVLSDLAARERDRLLELARGMLRWQAELRPEEFASNWNADLAAVRQAMSALGSRGLVGFDAARGAYFHRELPFDRSLVEAMHPRLEGARKLIDAGGVKLLRRDDDTVEAEVSGTDVIHRVRLSDSGDRCTCPWHAKHQGSRGPCKHVLAVQILAEEVHE